jgi:hypothetical protein
MNLFPKPPLDGAEPLFTSAIVSVLAGYRIAVFLTGRQHAGENLADLLRRRAAELAPPIPMCDALSRNAPASLRVIVANCLAHVRRHRMSVWSFLSGTAARSWKDCWSKIAG